VYATVLIKPIKEESSPTHRHAKPSSGMGSFRTTILGNFYDAIRVIMNSNEANTIAMYEEKKIGKDRRSNLK
jgi:hypothetical protein